MHTILFLLRYLRCELSLNHRWLPEPDFIDAMRIAHVCQRCGKRAVRHLS